MRKRVVWILIIALLGGCFLRWGSFAASQNGIAASLPIAGKVIQIGSRKNGEPGRR